MLTWLLLLLGIVGGAALLSGLLMLLTARERRHWESQRALRKRMRRICRDIEERGRVA